MGDSHTGARGVVDAYVGDRSAGISEYGGPTLHMVYGVESGHLYHGLWEAMELVLHATSHVHGTLGQRSEVDTVQRQRVPTTHIKLRLRGSTRTAQLAKIVTPYEPTVTTSHERNPIRYGRASTEPGQATEMLSAREGTRTETKPRAASSKPSAAYSTES